MDRSSSLVRTIDAVSVVDQVTVEIRRSIMSGGLAPGQEFSLRGLAEQLGVSLIPVRESLRRLETEGLVITRRARSAIVAPLELSELHDIYRLRRQIEPEIVARSCLLMGASALEDLKALQREHASAVDRDVRHEAHYALHLAMLAPAATAWDLRVIEMLWNSAERYVRFAFRTLEKNPAEPKRRGRAHADLVSAFGKRDPVVMAEAMREHLDNTENFAVMAIGRRTALDSTSNRLVEEPEVR
ncbi:GntR family transcriptional regulator [Nocardioides sp.]|uniref:GntR family transcriptional regulator n=1 Tax=Nocardioides sp. TaxID=35761 RepID=UPI003D0F13D8